MRKRYLDNIRWVTVIVVVIYHVLYMYNAEGIQGGIGKITDLKVQIYDLYQYAVYPWIMMVLFIVSGMVSREFLKNHSDSEYIRIRTRKLLIPSTVGLFAFHFIQGWINLEISSVWAELKKAPMVMRYFVMCISGIGVLWFIQILWALSMMLILIQRVEKDRLWKKTSNLNMLLIFMLVFLIYISAQILNMPIVTVYRFGYYGIAFFIGYFVLSHDEVIQRIKNSFWILLPIAIITGFVFCKNHFGENYGDTPLNSSFIFVLYGWETSLTIISGFARFFDYRNQLTDWMNSRSFGLYLFHYLGISAVALFVAKPCLLPAGFCYFLSAGAGFGLSILLFELISRIPFMRWAVLGMKEKKDVFRKSCNSAKTP